MTPSIRLVLALLALGIAACGDSQQTGSAGSGGSGAAPPAPPPRATPEPAPPPAAKPAPTPPAPASVDRELAPGETLVIETEDTIAFPIKSFAVKSGTTVRITLRKTGVMPKTAMAHNLVILKPGVNVDALALEAVAAADRSYIPAGAEGRILAHTKLLGNGESDSIEFQAPAPGSYEFICTFPGHYALMRGKMIVR